MTGARNGAELRELGAIRREHGEQHAEQAGALEDLRRRFDAESERQAELRAKVDELRQRFGRLERRVTLAAFVGAAIVQAVLEVAAVVGAP